MDSRRTKAAIAADGPGVARMRFDSQLLLKTGLIDQNDLDAAFDVRKESGGRLVDILISQGKFTWRQLLEAVRDQLGIPFEESIPSDAIDPEALATLSTQQCKELEVLPLSFSESGMLRVAFSDPTNLQSMDDVRFITGTRVEPILVEREVLYAAQAEAHPETKQIESWIRELDTGDILEAGGEEGRDSGDSLDLSDTESYKQAPVISLVNLILKQAILTRASDIHLEPKENHVRLRYRIDGTLCEKDPIQGKYKAAVTARLKVLSRLDISEKRIPQDGSFSILIEGRKVDFRVSTFPTPQGEKVVLRILDKSAVRLTFKDLNFPEQMAGKVHDLIHRHEGIFLVTGPTGSGKSTTLYTLLSEVDSAELNIVTLEDPIEYQIGTITQGQVNPKAGFTFAGGLRSILRQDPDVVLVGEIRDLETARIAVQASLTGHLVFSSLHTNSACEVIVRLQDMGLEPFLLAAAIRGALAQRLARRLCLVCREPFDPLQEMVARFSAQSVSIPPGRRLYRPVGCKACNDLGYKGRVPLFELFRMTDEAQRTVARGAEGKELMDIAVADGFRTLRQHGLELAVEGLTTEEEVYRVT